MDLIQQYVSASESSEDERTKKVEENKTNSSPVREIIKDNIDNLKKIDDVLGVDLQIVSIKKR